MIDGDPETLPISSIRSMNVTVRNRQEERKEKAKWKKILKKFFNPKVTSLFHRGLGKLDDSSLVTEFGALSVVMPP